MCLENSSLQKMISSVYSQKYYSDNAQSITAMIKILLGQLSEYYSDNAQNITVMLRILLSGSSEYYSDDAQNITVMLRILLSWLSEYISDDALDIEKICPSRGSISRIWSRFGVGIRSFSWNWSVRNGKVLGESSTYFREASRRLSTRQEWDWHAPDACWHLTTRNMPQEFGFHSLLWFFPNFPLTLD